MNIENMRKLRTRLRSRKNPVRFTMENWLTHNGTQMGEKEEILSTIKEHPCGTTACLAGFATILAWEEDFPLIKADDRRFFSIGKKFLGLSTDEADHLFYGRWPERTSGKLKGIPKTHAIKELTRLIDLEELSSFEP